jgi:hypothetical protein
MAIVQTHYFCRQMEWLPFINLNGKIYNKIREAHSNKSKIQFDIENKKIYHLVEVYL